MVSPFCLHVLLHLGDTLRNYLATALHDFSPAELTEVLTSGIRNDEVRGGPGRRSQGSRSEPCR